MVRVEAANEVLGTPISEGLNGQPANWEMILKAHPEFFYVANRRYKVPDPTQPDGLYAAVRLRLVRPFNFDQHRELELTHEESKSLLDQGYSVIESALTSEETGRLIDLAIDLDKRTPLLQQESRWKVSLFVPILASLVASIIAASAAITVGIISYKANMNVSELSQKLNIYHESA